MIFLELNPHGSSASKGWEFFRWFFFFLHRVFAVFLCSIAPSSFFYFGGGFPKRSFAADHVESSKVRAVWFNIIPHVINPYCFRFNLLHVPKESGSLGKLSAGAIRAAMGRHGRCVLKLGYSERAITMAINGKNSWDDWMIFVNLFWWMGWWKLGILGNWEYWEIWWIDEL